MPIYEFRCEHGHQFEVMQRITDDPVSSCQLCEAPVERVFHPVAVHFKGSGFYTTDYGRRNGSRSEKGEGESSSDGKGSDAKSSDSKATESKDKKSDTPKSEKANKAAA
jgi:putative FmdB family regulatory protein